MFLCTFPLSYFESVCTFSNTSAMTAQTDNKPVYHWKDVTEEFVDAAGELQLGELLHDAS